MSSGKIERTHPFEPDEFDQRTKTFLCRIVSGEPSPGYEPEAVAAGHSAIGEVGWFDLRHPETWDALLLSDYITFPLMQKIRAAEVEWTV